MKRGIRSNKTSRADADRAFTAGGGPRGARFRAPPRPAAVIVKLQNISTSEAPTRSRNRRTSGRAHLSSSCGGTRGAGAARRARPAAASACLSLRTRAASAAVSAGRRGGARCSAPSSDALSMRRRSTSAARSASSRWWPACAGAATAVTADCEIDHAFSLFLGRLPTARELGDARQRAATYQLVYLVQRLLVGVDVPLQLVAQRRVQRPQRAARARRQPVRAQPCGGAAVSPARESGWGVAVRLVTADDLFRVKAYDDEVASPELPGPFRSTRRRVAIG